MLPASWELDWIEISRTAAAGLQQIERPHVSGMEEYDIPLGKQLNGAVGSSKTCKTCLHVVYINTCVCTAVRAAT